VIDTELYGLLREKHGDGFHQIIQEKVVALAGDITHENLGLEASVLEELAKEIDAIVNIAATTNFYERYDVSLDVNVMGVKHLCHFAKRCRPRINMFMHASTAFVCGDRPKGLILEKPIQPGKSLREGTYLDVDVELRLVSKAKEAMTTELASGKDSPLLDDDARKMTTVTMAERKVMKEVGLRRARHFGWSNTYTFTKAMGEMVLGQQLQEERGDHMMPPVVIVRPSIITIDTLIIGYAEQKLSCFLGDLSVVVDVIPGDMVVNAMMAAMVAHYSEEPHAQAVPPPVYHATSSLRNPVTYGVLYESGRRHFYKNPRVVKDDKVIPTREMRFFKTIARFHLYMMLTFKLPLEVHYV
jgi:fatty acyl-CoA reductase